MSSLTVLSHSYLRSLRIVFWSKSFSSTITTLDLLNLYSIQASLLDPCSSSPYETNCSSSASELSELILPPVRSVIWVCHVFNQWSPPSSVHFFTQTLVFYTSSHCSNSYSYCNLSKRYVDLSVVSCVRRVLFADNISYLICSSHWRSFFSWIRLIRVSSYRERLIQSLSYASRIKTLFIMMLFHRISD